MCYICINIDFAKKVNLGYVLSRPNRSKTKPRHEKNAPTTQKRLAAYAG